MPEEEVSGNGFTVKDKRSFDSKGDLKEKTDLIIAQTQKIGKHK